MSMAASLEVRVPFADHRLVEYVFNTPWEVRFKNNTEKYLLREAMKDFLPEKILNRKKSPYPKTHNPAYEAMAQKKLEERLARKESRIAPLLKKEAPASIRYMENQTWFGQLMGRPQLLAWLIQTDFWLEHYNVEFII